MFNATVDDHRAEALWRSGEPQDTTSSFWVKSLDYINRVYQGLVIGGSFAVGRDLATSAGIYAHVVGMPITDWPWARKLGVIMTTPAIYLTGTVSLTQGSDIATFNTGITPRVFNWRLVANNLPTVPLILAHNAGDATAKMDAPWPEVNQVSVTFALYQDAYDLPADFIRFATPPYSHAYWRNPISVATREQQDMRWPMGMMTFRSPPYAAYIRQGGRSVALSGWDTRSYRVEYEYIAEPTPLEAGMTPILPQSYRPVLSVGAAMLIAFDKGDPRAKELASEYRETVAAMIQEWRRALSGGSSVYGAFKCRQPWYRLRSLQPMGELFLV